MAPKIPKSLQRLKSGARKFAGGAKRLGKAGKQAVRGIKERDLGKLKKAGKTAQKGVKKATKGAMQVKKAGSKQIAGAKRLKTEFLGS